MLGLRRATSLLKNFPRKKERLVLFVNIFDEVNSLPEAVIVRRLGLSTARDGKSFVCPECGNGSGSTGDGIKQTKLKGKLVWHCYRCGGHWSNVDLIGVTEGIREQAELGQLEELFPESKPFLFSKEDFATKSPPPTKPFLFSREGFSHFSAAERQASKSASRVFGYRSEGESRASSDSCSRTPWTVSSPSVDADQIPLTVPPASELPKNYGKTFYPRYKEMTRKFLTERGGSYRGLTSETFEKYGIVRRTGEIADADNFV